MFVQYGFEDGVEAGEGVFFLCGGGGLLLAREQRLEGGLVFEGFGDASTEEFEVADDFAVARRKVGMCKELLQICGKQSVAVEEVERNQAQAVGVTDTVFVQVANNLISNVLRLFEIFV